MSHSLSHVILNMYDLSPPKHTYLHCSHQSIVEFSVITATLTVKWNYS